MKFTLRCALCALSLITVSGAANAALLERRDSEGNVFAIYDDVANLTWLADANYSKTSGYDSDGSMTWSEANEWAENLVLGGFDDWRLPTTTQPDASCSSQGGSESYGYNCTGSEMGNLFYKVLGGTADNPPNFGAAGFENVLSFYWSATEYAPNTNYAWVFVMYNGSQNYNYKAGSNYAWAVRSGDVSAVPVPAAVWLFGSGLLGLFGLGRRRSANR